MYKDTAEVKGFLAFGLYFISSLYGLAVRARTLGYKTGYFKTIRLPCKVVSVGNITIGGAGKTPMVLFLAEMLYRKGLSPAVLSRGYKGGAEKYGGVVSDGRTFHMNAEDAGDEPMMMATRLRRIGVPVIVGRDRIQSGKLAIKSFQPDVILLDDAYQHLKLWRDLNLVLLDSQRPFGNSFLLPLGILREPETGLSRGDIFIITRTQRCQHTLKNRLRNIIGGKPIYTAFHQPSLVKWIGAHTTIQQSLGDIDKDIDIRLLCSKKVFGFSGMAVNNNFKQTLESMNCELVGFKGFADHYPYTQKDIISLLRSASRAGADTLCTTEKDYVRLSRYIPLSVDLAVMDVKISLGSKLAAFEKDIIKYLNGSNSLSGK
jgi:tetraacyldisaccharide 4'-kinase